MRVHMQVCVELSYTRALEKRKPKVLHFPCLTVEEGFQLFKWEKRKKKTNGVLGTVETFDLIDRDAKALPLDEGEKVVGALPIYIGGREGFDPTHPYSCASVRDKITSWKLGAFITTSKHLLFRQFREDRSFFTALKVPLEGVYTVEVSGIQQKRLEICTDAGSFEFKGFDDDDIYRFRDSIQELADMMRQFKREEELPTRSMVLCEYCQVKNEADASFCVNCGAPLR